jgi:16S rRNA U516 pseudouridylate synthase RsuA-like enzyme
MSDFNYKKYVANNPLLSEDLNISKDDMEKLHKDGEVKIDGKKVTFKEEKKEVNEVQDRTEALDKLRDMLEDLKFMSREANELLSSYFPSAHTRAEAYGALDFGTSSNKYDTTLESIIDGLERGIDVD